MSRIGIISKEMLMLDMEIKKVIRKYKVKGGIILLLILLFLIALNIFSLITLESIAVS